MGDARWCLLLVPVTLWLVLLALLARASFCTVDCGTFVTPLLLLLNPPHTCSILVCALPPTLVSLLCPPPPSLSPAVICITQGAGEVWQYRGQSYHPFHLHETPVQLQEQPRCLAANGVETTFWQVS